MKTSNIYDESFEFCDEDKDEIVTMEELMWCESEFLDALNRKHNYQMTKMTIGDKNKDGKLHKEEWRAAGAVWDLGKKKLHHFMLIQFLKWQVVSEKTKKEEKIDCILFRYYPKFHFYTF